MERPFEKKVALITKESPSFSFVAEKSAGRVQHNVTASQRHTIELEVQCMNGSTS